MPNSNALGLIVGSGEKRYTTILIDEELGQRFRIGDGIHCEIGG